MKATEDNFIHLIKRRDERGILYVVDQYGGVISAVVKKGLFCLPNMEEECINDVLLAIWEHIGDYNPDKGSFKNWAAGIARYKAIDYKRKYLKEHGDVSLFELSVPVTDQNAQKELLRLELQEEIDEILHALSEEDQEIFKQIFFQEESVQQVAEKTGKTETTIYQRIFRERKKLRNLFGKGEFS